MITMMVDNKEVGIKWLEFSDGALTCKIDADFPVNNYLSLTVCPSTLVKQVLEELSLVYNALCHCTRPWCSKFILNLPYLPYGRADRVFEKGNPDALSYFLNELSNFDFDEINICDIHNFNAIDGYHLPISEKTQKSCFIRTIPKNKQTHYDYVVAPDKGATKKAQSIADHLGIPCIMASKERDLSTGRIINTTLNVKLPVGSSVIIVDDIGDYCGTHIALAEVLNEMGCLVDLYVTHLIAPKGLSRLRGVINKVYCYHTVGGYINRGDVLEFNNGKIY